MSRFRRPLHLLQTRFQRWRWRRALWKRHILPPTDQSPTYSREQQQAHQRRERERQRVVVPPVERLPPEPLAVRFRRWLWRVWLWRRSIPKEELAAIWPPAWLRTTSLVGVPLLLMASVAASAGGQLDPRLQVATGGLPLAGEPLPAGVARLREAVERDPSSVNLHLQLAQEYMKQDMFRDALGEFQATLRIDQDNAAARRGIAGVMRRIDHHQGALDLAQQEVDRQPASPEALAQHAAAQTRAGLLAEALATYAQALKSRPRDWLMLLNAAACAARARDWERAESYCRRSLAATEQDASPRVLLAMIFFEQGKVEPGVAELERLDADRANTAAVQHLLGRARLAQGQLTDSLRAFERAQRLQLDWHVPCVDAGIVCLRLKDYSGAAQNFRRALERSPNSVTAAIGLGIASDNLGQIDQAITVYEAVLAANPKLSVAMNNLAYNYARKGRNLDRALQMASEVSRAHPRNGTVRDTLGWVSFLAGRQTEALLTLQEAVRLAPGYPLAHYHLGKVLQAAGRKEEAATAYRAALRRGLAAPEKRDAETALGSLPAG